MFNVYPVQLRYTRVKSTGVLAGIPLKCTFGVATVEDAKKAIADLTANANGDNVYQFEIDIK